MAPVAEDTARTEGSERDEDLRITIIGGALVPPETVQDVFDGLRQLLPVKVPAPKKKDEEKAAKPAPSWMADPNNPTDLAAALELFHHVQDQNYPLVAHLDRLEQLDLALRTPPRTSQLNEKRPSPMHVRAIILAALYFDKGELRLRDPRPSSPTA